MTVRKKLQSHLAPEHYRAAKELRGGPGSLGRRLLDHLGEVCADCLPFWHQLGRLRTTLFERLDELEPPDEEVSDPREWSVTEEDLEETEREEKEMRRRRRRSWEQKSILLRTPREKRRERILGARSRYQSRLLAEGLLADGRGLLRTAPKKAAQYFSLVPLVLRRATSESGPEWAWAMVLLSRALRANALRITGELKDARAIFDAIHEEREKRPVTDASTAGDLASLEASLLTDLREYDLAAETLQKAVALFGASGDKSAKARVTIQMAHLHQEIGEPGTTLELFESASLLLEQGPDARLLLTTITGQINALCDLDRADEALALLEGSLDLYEDAADPYAGIYYRALHGRTSLALKHHDEAKSGLEAAVEGFVALERGYDATLAALDLARAYLLSGETKKVGRLAVSLAKRFASQGVEEEAQQALFLLADAWRAEELSLTLLMGLRQTLASSAPSR